MLIDFFLHLKNGRLPVSIKELLALLEAPDIAERCELLVQLMQFFGRRDDDEGRVTLQ